MWQPFIIKQQLKIAEIYTLFEVEYQSGFVFNGETHSFWECLYVEDGEAVVTGGESVYRLSTGEIIFHKPLEMHKFYVDSTTKLFVFSFSMEGAITDFFCNKVFRLTSKQIQIMSLFLEYMYSKNAELHKDYKSFTKNLSSDNIYANTISVYISMLFLSLYEENAISTAADTTETLVFKKAVKFMDDNKQAMLSIDEIAKHCSISNTGLKRIFFKYAGFGIHKYFIKLKISVATQLLSDGKSVTETAEALGFSSQGYFSFVFKRETGLSPTDYTRRQG